MFGLENDRLVQCTIKNTGANTLFLYAALSFTDLIRYLFSVSVVTENKLAFLSNNLCQDPLEKFFGCQRQRGGTSDNPSVLEFCRNTQAVTVDKENCVPLQKRSRKQ